MFGEHFSNESGDMTYLICHMTSQDRVIKGSCDFMSGRFLICHTTLPSVMTIETVVVETCF